MRPTLRLPAIALATTLVVSVPAAAQQPLETIRNYQDVDARLSSAGQIAYDQIPLLASEGFEVVVNLAAASRERNGEEGFLVAETGLTYIHIPVDWEMPRLSDVEMFFDVM